jgi:tetratricopeptide (TPR) repeat protein
VAQQANDAAGAEQLLQRALEWARAETIQTLPAAQTVLAATELADRLGTAEQGLALRREAVRMLIQARDRRRAVDVLIEIGARLAAAGDTAGAYAARREGLRHARAIYYLDAVERLNAELKARRSSTSRESPEARRG